MKILMCAGHVNLHPGGDAVEQRISRAITPKLALHCVARGADATMVTPHADGTVTITLTQRAMQVVEINEQQRVDIFLEIHANLAPQRGCFVVFPDWPELNDTDVQVRDTLGPGIAKAIRDATTIPLLGNGTMSEKVTEVGSSGSRLGVFKLTRSIKSSCRRMIVEVGNFTHPSDLAILDRPDTPGKIGRAIAGVLVPVATRPAAWGTLASFNPDFGIPLTWCEELMAGRSLGRAMSQEFAHGGKTWQLFTNGAISFAQGAGAQAHRPAPADVVQAAPGGVVALSEQSPLLSAPRTDIDQAANAILARPHGEYTEQDVREVIVPAYFELCASVGIDPLLAIAQMIHETGNLTSFWSARPQRNPAGIGVTGQNQLQEPDDATNWAFNTQRQRWEQGLSFASWQEAAVVAHVGRLLAWALPQATETPAQHALIERALQFRPLPDNLRGSAPNLKRLGANHNPTGQGWARPGDDYGARVAAVAQRIIGT